MAKDQGNSDDILKAAQFTAEEYVDKGKWHDGLTGENKILYIAKATGMNKLVPATHEARGNIALRKNSTVQEYRGLDPIRRRHSNTMELWRYFNSIVGANVTLSNDELEDNMGKNRMSNILLNEIKSARATLSNELNDFFHRSAFAPNKIPGLGWFYPVGGGGKVGGIDSADFEDWKSVSISTSTPTGTAPSGDLVIENLGKALRRTSHGTGGATVMEVTDPIWNIIQKHMDNLVRVQPTDMEKQVSQFMFRFQRARFDWNEADGFGLDDYKAYFWRPEDLCFYYHGKKGWKVGKAQDLIESDGITILIKAKITPVCKNRRHGGEYHHTFT